MAIECHKVNCKHHDCHTDPESGPFCYEDVCHEELIKKAVWRAIDTAPKEDSCPVLLWSPDFIDLDFNPSGVVDGYFDEEMGWTAAVWNGCQDCWDTKGYLEPTHWKEKHSPTMEIYQ